MAIQAQPIDNQALGQAADAAAEQRSALVERLFLAALMANEIGTVYLGDRLGLYRALVETGPATSVELAARTGTAERYVREWLEQQAVAGFLEVAEPNDDPQTRRFRLPPGHADVLTERDCPEYSSPLARLVIGVLQPLPALIEAFRTGQGVPYPAYGADTREGIADLNRVMYIGQLGQAWLPAVPDVHARLQADPPARVADIGCGSGESSLAIARSYPKSRVDGFDLDAPSIVRAQASASAAGLTDRVSFAVRDAADPALARSYDLVTAFECIHDMSRPVEALRAMRGLVAEGGTVLVVDELVADEFTAPGDELERFNYGFSVLHCLPVGMEEQPSAGTGTVMRSSTLRRYAAEAGYREVEILPIEHPIWRFYRLHP